MDQGLKTMNPLAVLYICTQRFNRQCSSIDSDMFGSYFGAILQYLRFWGFLSLDSAHDYTRVQYDSAHLEHWLYNDQGPIEEYVINCSSRALAIQRPSNWK